MILTICYNDNTSKFNSEITKYCQESFPNLKVISYNEDNFQEKKKSYKIKGGYSARISPFMLLTGDDKEYIKAFYSEAKECTLDALCNILNSI